MPSRIAGHYFQNEQRQKCEVGAAVDGYRDKCFNQDYSFNIDQWEITYMRVLREASGGTPLTINVKHLIEGLYRAQI